MLQVSLFLVPPSTKFIVMAPRVYPCPTAQELPGNVGWTSQMTEKKKQRYINEQKKAPEKKLRKKAEIWCGDCVSMQDSIHPPTRSKELTVVGTEGVTALLFSSLQALLFPQERMCSGAWTRLSIHTPLHPTGFSGVVRTLLGLIGQAGDTESFWMARPDCKEAS